MAIVSQLPLACAARAANAPTVVLSVTTSTAGESLTWACSAGSLAAPTTSSDLKTVSRIWSSPPSDAVVTISCTSASGGSASWTVDSRSAWAQPGRPALSGPVTGAVGAQAGPFVFGYSVPWFVGMPDMLVTPVSNVVGDTFQAAYGGPAVSSVALAGGGTAVQFWLLPATSGARRISVQCSNPFDPSLAGTYIDFTAG